MTPPPDFNNRKAIDSPSMNKSGGGVSAVWVISRMVIKEIFRKKDFYVALILTGVILFYASNLQFYNVQNIVRYLMELGLMLIFLFSAILTVSLAARQYPAEIQNRTSYVLLAKPISRWQFVAGKFLGSLLAGWAAFGIFYVLFLAIVWAKAGSLSTVSAAQVFYLFLLNLAVLAAMASAFSYVLTTSANISVTLILYILINTYGPGLKEAGEKLSWVMHILYDTVYYLLPHFEFFDMRQRFIHEWEPVSTGLLGFLTLYALFYTTFFLMLGWIALRRRPI